VVALAYTSRPSEERHVCQASRAIHRRFALDPTTRSHGPSYRISIRSSGGTAGRPARHFSRQKIRQPSRCQRTMVDGRTFTTASRQSHSLVNSARPTRVTWSTRRGLTPRSMYRASCRRSTRFSARIEDGERKNSMPKRTTSARKPMIARNTGHMCASCQIQMPTAGASSAKNRSSPFLRATVRSSCLPFVAAARVGQLGHAGPRVAAVDDRLHIGNIRRRQGEACKLTEFIP